MGKFLPASKTALGAQLSVLLSGIMNVTWVKVLASFSIEQSSINCRQRGPRFQGTHSANDLLPTALGEGRKNVASGCHGPTSAACSVLSRCGGVREGHGDLEVPVWTFTSVLTPDSTKAEAASGQVPQPSSPYTHTHPEKLPKCLKCSCTPRLYLFVV